MSIELPQAFSEIGAALADQTFGRGFQIDIVNQGEGELELPSVVWYSDTKASI
ncbi:MAG: hypothetical protein V4719_18375 [Planctomycetota bacterium]